ncbi:MAG: HEPN domain-containing protein [Myxococcales bacterium]|nr:HEPN domain-containing protein [Myxococcales bacterium]
MTSLELGRSYLRSARRRLAILPVLRDSGGFNDVVREAQEIVELALKALLRTVGIDPPHLHDVGEVLLQHAELLPEPLRPELPGLAEASRELRRNRELAFYGAADFLPDLEYSRQDADRAMRTAEQAVKAAESVFGSA